MSSLRERMARLRGTAAAAADVPPEKAEEAKEGGRALPELPDLRVAPMMADVAVAAEVLEVPDRPEVLEAADAGQAIDQLDGRWLPLGVRLATNAWGDFLLRERRYSLDYKHGDQHLQELLEVAGHLGRFHPGSEGLGAIGAEQLLMLDLETTGLGAGTGNLPFMVGIAYYSEGTFQVEQMVIRHPAEERAMLGHLLQLLGGFRYLVTYNGKTFDWPLLQSRFVLNGFRGQVPDILHLDFLHPSRSIWRNTLASCKLSYVEEQRLGFWREDDVPGSLAPALYFQFLSDGDPAPLAGVYRHNELDMLTLAALAIRFGRLLGCELGTRLPLPAEDEELARSGLWLERMGLQEEAERIFALLERRLGQSSGKLTAYLPLAARDKKCGNWQRAVVLWQKAAVIAEQSASPNIEAHIELSMYNEHRSRDLHMALRFAERAFALAAAQPEGSGSGPQDSRAKGLAAIRKRIDRLSRKIRG